MNFSFLTKKCERRAQSGGYGVFALETIAKDELVAMWGG